jgi:hypothetical protein
MMITSASPEWVKLSAIYHHVLIAFSPEAKIDISRAWGSGHLHLFAAKCIEYRAGDGRFGKCPEPIVTHNQPVPCDDWGPDSEWEWVNSHAIRHDKIARSLFEYSDISARRDDVLKLWPAATTPVPTQGQATTQNEAQPEKKPRGRPSRERQEAVNLIIGIFRKIPTEAECSRPDFFKKLKADRRYKAMTNPPSDTTFLRALNWRTDKSKLAK